MLNRDNVRRRGHEPAVRDAGLKGTCAFTTSGTPQRRCGSRPASRSTSCSSNSVTPTSRPRSTSTDTPTGRPIVRPLRAQLTGGERALRDRSRYHDWYHAGSEGPDDGSLRASEGWIQNGATVRPPPECIHRRRQRHGGRGRPGGPIRESSEGDGRVCTKSQTTNPLRTLAVPQTKTRSPLPPIRIAEMSLPVRGGPTDARILGRPFGHEPSATS